jgi:hypothetical protein
VKALKLPTGCRVAHDGRGQAGVLFPSSWTERYFGEINPGVVLLETPIEAGNRTDDTESPSH